MKHFKCYLIYIWYFIIIEKGAEFYSSISKDKERMFVNKIHSLFEDKSITSLIKQQTNERKNSNGNVIQSFRKMERSTLSTQVIKMRSSINFVKELNKLKIDKSQISSGDLVKNYNDNLNKVNEIYDNDLSNQKDNLMRLLKQRRSTFEKMSETVEILF